MRAYLDSRLWDPEAREWIHHQPAGMGAIRSQGPIPRAVFDVMLGSYLAGDEAIRGRSRERALGWCSWGRPRWATTSATDLPDPPARSRRSASMSWELLGTQSADGRGPSTPTRRSRDS